MSELFPERPLLFYPSLALRYGADEALLLSILDDLFRQHAAVDDKGEMLLLAPGQLSRLTPFWTTEVVSETLQSLERQSLLQATKGQNGTLKLYRFKSHKATQPRQVSTASIGEHLSEPIAQPIAQHRTDVRSESSSNSLPVYDTPPPAKEMRPRRSAAPTFGGNAGWRRGKDELQQIFDRHEERNQRLVPMELGWKPSAAFFDMLSRQSITPAFAEQSLDEFILYYLDKDRKETNWDQKFLAWVKREWVHKQSREASSRANEQQPLGHSNENTRRDTRENRKRVTASIMDIEDTNW
ncbi:DnaT-like ssDNA-binding domain-containing protein [Nitrincola schmidtii]|uniref:DnaT-like ssDNA-binding domain-containing protein n=1 Tax=Nitrincola schmidtii TaxID=1730894 RepID=UPI00124F166D|nr:DnaT-like ssDNA-binding domain-containing protein [Nitrincola schmidtii]